MQKPLEAGEGALPGLGQVAGNEEVGPVVGKARREALRPGLGRKAEGALEEGEPFRVGLGGNGEGGAGEDHAAEGGPELFLQLGGHLYGLGKVAPGLGDGVQAGEVEGLVRLPLEDPLPPEEEADGLLQLLKKGPDLPQEERPGGRVGVQEAFQPLGQGLEALDKVALLPVQEGVLLVPGPGGFQGEGEAVFRAAHAATLEEALHALRVGP